MDKSGESEIDDSLYSRQRYVLGDSAMQKMARSSVFLSGLGGLGVEIAKNIVLAGIKSLTVHDTCSATWMDLGSQFFLTEDDVINGKNRAEASLSKLAELNPYVTLNHSSASLAPSSDLSFLDNYQCVILTDCSLELQGYIDNYCRAQHPPKKFISCSVRGVFSSVFCDFGPEFVVYDSNGEEPAEFFIGNITKGNPAVVKCLDNHLHNLETGDTIAFSEVVGMLAINGTAHTVKVINPATVSIGDTSSDQYGPYEHGGIARQLKTPHTVTFESLEAQLKRPALLFADLAKLETPLQAHLAFLSFDRFLQQRRTLPKPRDESDAEAFVALAAKINVEKQLVEVVDEELMRRFSSCAGGTLPPLVTAIGGVVAQEALISLTGKFSPLQQWLYLDAVEVLPDKSADQMTFQPLGDRYDAVRVCLGEDLLEKLARLRLFMVGCGAIGCEMLKNYAMLGVGRKPNGLVTITDNDLIEKSNLNRQFLFKPHHIQKPKSVIAAKSALSINPDLCIDALEHKVFPGTEAKVFNDKFFQAQDLVVNALDNVEARRYVDGRCVTNQRPLLESGTLGAKGHVQVIVPHLTESYSSQQDPPDKDVPYCTLKSFPATIEHTIQWARDKFESMFSQNPAMYCKFWETHGNPQHVLQLLKEQQSLPDGIVKAVKILDRFPADWKACVRLARFKFERYFNHKAKNLIHVFPMDTKLKDGSLFWQSPKRPPTPLVFDIVNPMHLSFVVSMARLWADVFRIPYTEEDLSVDAMATVIRDTPVPEFKVSSKEIITDESVKKPEAKAVGMDVADRVAATLETLCCSSPQGSDALEGKLKATPLSFEKDDDANGHIDFITAASNLRATMYSIEPVDRFKTKLIAGRIVPAIATTTAAVAGLVSIELIKVVSGAPLEHLKNAFLSLALPTLVFSEPAPPARTLVKEGLSFTAWDRWEVKGSSAMKLQEFLKAVKDKYGLEPAMVVMGVKMIYVPWMPGHSKRLKQSMVQLLKVGGEKEYVDLFVSFDVGQSEDASGPPIRYYIN